MVNTQYTIRDTQYELLKYAIRFKHHASRIMQNKPNLRKAQMNITSVTIKIYEHIRPPNPRKNKPNSNPNKPNYKKAKMTVTKVSTNGYENIHLRRRTENKPNQTQLFSSLPPKGRIVSPLRVSVPEGTEQFHRSGAKPFSENGAEKGLTTHAGSDSLKINRWTDKAACLCKL